MDKNEMKSWFEKQLGGFDLEFKTLFGNPTWLVNGNMFAKVEKEMFVFRIGADDKAAMTAAIPVKQYIMFNGKPVKDFVTFGADLANADFKAWFKKGFDAAKKLPAKVK